MVRGLDQMAAAAGLIRMVAAETVSAQATGRHVPPVLFAEGRYEEVRSYTLVRLAGRGLDSGPFGPSGVPSFNMATTRPIFKTSRPTPTQTT